MYGIGFSFLSSWSGAIVFSNNRFLFEGESKLGSNKNFQCISNWRKVFCYKSQAAFCFFPLRITNGKTSLFSVCRTLCSESLFLPSHYEQQQKNPQDKEQKFALSQIIPCPVEAFECIIFGDGYDLKAAGEMHSTSTSSYTQRFRKCQKTNFCACLIAIGC